MSISASTSTQPIRNAQFAQSHLVGLFSLQTLALALALSMAYIRTGHTYEPQLIQECLWGLPLAFFFGQTWYLVRWKTGKLENFRRDYAAFGQRFLVICVVLTIVIGQLIVR